MMVQSSADGKCTGNISGPTIRLSPSRWIPNTDARPGANSWQIPTSGSHSLTCNVQQSVARLRSCAPALDPGCGAADDQRMTQRCWQTCRRRCTTTIRRAAPAQHNRCPRLPQQHHRSACATLTAPAFCMCHPPFPAHEPTLNSTTTTQRAHLQLIQLVCRRTLSAA